MHDYDNPMGFDLDAVLAAASNVSWALIHAQPVVLVYEPGNGTRYDLTFVPLDICQGDRARIGFSDIDPYTCVVAMTNGEQQCYPFNLSHQAHRTAGRYIGEKLRLHGDSDREAVRLLFEWIVDGMDLVLKED